MMSFGIPSCLMLLRPIFLAKGEWAALMWLDDPFVLWVAGELPPAELTQIAEGISISVK